MGNKDNVRLKPLSPFRSDGTQAIDREAEDHFGHRDYAETITGALERVPSQFTIGLFGPWGSGKSTILEEVRRRLHTTASDTAFAIFDAWRYDGDSLRREFIREVGAQLQAAGKLSSDYDVGERTRSFDADFSKEATGRWHPKLKELLPAGLAALVAALVIVSGYAAASLLDLSKETTLEAEIAILGALTAFLLTAATRVISPARIQETRRRFEYPDQFARSFAELLDEVTARQLVIGIDNLDRCSPPRVSEILSTIKTFLEPAIEKDGEGGAQDLCFLIAADDEALHRHLLAEEIARSAKSSSETSTVERLASEAVGEYLRKFFNATIRITDVLAEDMTKFTEHEFSDFVAAHPEISPSRIGTLTEMAAQGLKRNPRRLKQFINNFELRLQLLAARQRSGYLLESPDVLVVAKLAILEEEYPDRYRQLLANPDRLTAWHDLVAQAGQDVPLPEGLVAFLRFTDDIRPRNIRPYLSLKQTRDELELPGYEELVGLLDDGDAKGLEQLLDSEEQLERAEYVDAARRYSEHLIREQAWSRAHNALRAAIGVDSLRGKDPLVDDLLDKALIYPHLRERLSQLSPAVLLPAARGPRFDIVLSIFLEASSGSEESLALRKALFAALAENTGELAESSRERLRAALRTPPLVNDFASYEPLIRADPELADEAILDAALSAVEEDPNAILKHQPAFSIVLDTLHKGNPIYYSRLFAAARVPIAKSRKSSSGRLSKLYEILFPLVNAVSEDRVLLHLLDDIKRTWSETPLENRWLDLDFAIAVCKASQRADGLHGADIGALALGLNGEEGFPRWLSGLPRLPVFFHEGFKGRIASAFSDLSDPLFDAASSTMRLLPAADRSLILVQAGRIAAAQERWDDASRCLDALDASGRRVVLSESIRELERETEKEKRLPLARFLARHQDLLSAEERERLAKALINWLGKSPGQAPELSPLIAAVEIDDDGVRIELVEQLLGLTKEINGPRRKYHALSAAFSLAGKDEHALAKAEERVKEMKASSDPMDRRATKDL